MISGKCAEPLCWSFKVTTIEDNKSLASKENDMDVVSLDKKIAIARAAGRDISPSSLDSVKTPLATRIKKSKFNKIISGMSDEDLKLTAYAICFNDSVAEAVKCYHTSVVNYVQVASLIKELDSRNIVIK